MTAPAQHKGKAIACSLAAIALANVQDAIVKGVSHDIPAYETLLIRCVFALPILGGWLWWSGNSANMLAGPVRALLARSLVLTTAYFSYILAMAAMPLATAVSIYFTMPFFVAALAGVALGERAPPYRWLAIAIGFGGVLLSVRPDASNFQPALLFGLYAAFAYAIAQMWGRRLSHRVAPIIILNWQNLTNFTLASTIGLVVFVLKPAPNADPALAFLTHGWAWPSWNQFAALAFMGVCSAFVAALFLNAYRFAEANFIAPFEYSAIIWATLYGALIFRDHRDVLDWAGTAIVIAAGLFMITMDRRRQSTG